MSEEADDVATKARRDAMMAGLDTVTEGKFQDWVYGILNLISSLLVGAQFFVNIKSLFGGTGCNKAGGFKMADVWFYVQLFLNGVATIAQLFSWGYMWTQTILFTWHHEKIFHDGYTFPTSKFAACTDPEKLYIQMKCESHADFDDSDEETKALIKQEVLVEVEEEGVPIVFKQSMKAMTKASVMQNHLSNFRAIIGAVGAIVEPALSANAAFKSVVNPIAVDPAKLMALAACESTRNTSAAASGIIAVIGLKQSQMKIAYARLIGLDQIRHEKIRDLNNKSKHSDEELTRFEIAAEAEIMDIIGSQGKSMMTWRGEAAQ